MPPPNPNRQYYPALDGLRGLAIILVLTFHFLGFLPAFRYGWMGIELFFVLSGFLISGRLIPFLGNSKLLPVYFRNRFLRIVPVYFGFLLIFFSCWFLFTSANTQAENGFYQKHWWQFFLFLQNWVYINDFQQSSNHLQHFWSLAVEEQFYLAYPLLLLLFFRKKYFLPALLIIITGISLFRNFYYLTQKDYLDYKQVYWNSFFRIDSFLCGALIYGLYQNYQDKYKLVIHTCGIISTIILTAGIIMFNDPDQSNDFFTMAGRTSVPMFFSYLLWLSITGEIKGLNRIFEHRWLTFTGKISYPLYIFHWPVLLIGFAVINRINYHLGIHAGFPAVRLVTICCATIITFTLSYLSYRYYESWFLKWKKKLD